MLGHNPGGDVVVLGPKPRVARASQPCAGRRNPLAIPAGSVHEPGTCQHVGDHLACLGGALHEGGKAVDGYRAPSRSATDEVLGPIYGFFNRKYASRSPMETAATLWSPMTTTLLTGLQALPNLPMAVSS